MACADFCGTVTCKGARVQLRYARVRVPSPAAGPIDRQIERHTCVSTTTPGSLASLENTESAWMEPLAPPRWRASYSNQEVSPFFRPTWPPQGLFLCCPYLSALEEVEWKAQVYVPTNGQCCFFWYAEALILRTQAPRRESVAWSVVLLCGPEISTHLSTFPKYQLSSCYGEFSLAGTGPYVFPKRPNEATHRAIPQAFPPVTPRVSSVQLCEKLRLVAPAKK